MPLQCNKAPLHLAIIGAGLLGRLSALMLKRQGYDVTLIDKDDQQGKQSSAYAAAGLLTPLGEAMHAPADIVSMGFESLALWPSIIASLEEHVFFQQDGSLMVSHEQDKPELIRHQHFLEKHYPSHEIRSLNRRDLLALEPEIGRSFSTGIFLPCEGQIGNRRLIKALTTELLKAGVSWYSSALVQTLSHQESCATIRMQHLDGTHKTVKADAVIDCRGIGACQPHSPAPLSGLRAVRGELFQLYAPDVNLNRPIRLMHPRYQLYIAPKSHGFYVVGATEIESNDMSPMTVRSAMELLSAAYSVHPGFAEANIRQHVSHCRPAFSDNRPKCFWKNNILHVNGLYRHGFLIAPVIVNQIVDHIHQFSTRTNQNTLLDRN